MCSYILVCYVLHNKYGSNVPRRNNSFVTEVVDFPLELPLGEWLNSALSLEDVDKDLQLVVPNCWATPSNDRNDPTRYPLFTDKYVNCSDVFRQHTLKQFITFRSISMFCFLSEVLFPVSACLQV